jgi:hypothetical protein
MSAIFSPALITDQFFPSMRTIHGINFEVLIELNKLEALFSETTISDESPPAITAIFGLVIIF